MDKNHPLYGQAQGQRTVRQATITSSEIGRVLQGGHKLDSSTVNALSAKFQLESEATGNPEWCIFSSWLGPLVTKKVKEGSPYGTIKEHVLSAVPDGQPATLLARTKWMIPLCSTKRPEHWVLAWIDFASAKIGIFDSIPELASSSWAEPLFLQVIDSVYLTLERPLIPWGSAQWKREVHSPSTLQCQMDGWSCGLFVLMAIEAIGSGKDIKVAVRHDDLKTVQARAVSRLLEIEVRSPRQPVVAGQDGTREETRERVEPASPDTVPLSNFQVQESTAMDVDPLIKSPEFEVVTDVQMRGQGIMVVAMGKKGGGTEETLPISLPHKRSRGLSDSAEKPKLCEKKPRKSKMSKTARSKMFENDGWVKKFDEYMVTCAGCKHEIKLSARQEREFEMKNWEDHKSHCPQITGLRKVRRSKKRQPSPVAVEREPKQNSISHFFVPKNRGQVPQVPVTERSDPGPSTQNEPNTDKSYLAKPIEYHVQVVNATPSIDLFWAKQTKAGQNQVTGEGFKPKYQSAVVPVMVPCRHLTGPEYDDYVSLINTREFGGISPMFIARASRQLFPYKMFAPLKPDSKAEETLLRFFGPPTLSDKPINSDTKDTNKEIERPRWTSHEHHQLECLMHNCARWIVDYGHRYAKSTHCAETTTNADGKQHEASLPEEERRYSLEMRQKYSKTDGVKALEEQAFRDKLKDPVLFNIYESLKTGRSEDCFLKLFESAQKGYLKDHQQFLNVCEVFEDRLARDHSDNSKAKYGVRYKTDYIQFITLMRGYGQNSNRQYEIYTSVFYGPSSRHIRALSVKSEDSLQNPGLIYENLARLKRYADSVRYTGPILVGGDCTKVRKRLNYSTDYGAHVLGTIYDLSEVEVDQASDIDVIVKRAEKEKAFATQVRAIIAKIPLPGSPAIVLALIPTNGTENADTIHLQHLKLQRLAAQVQVHLLVLAADGAASELSAQVKMDHIQSECPALVYDYPLYGIHLRAPVFRETGPLISITDPPHAKKTARNQPQYGTHTASLGRGHLVNQSLIDLYDTGTAGLVFRDVSNVDKQDNGAARRVFHSQALKACTTGDEDPSIRPGFEGLFSYLFVLGSLFEAWMSPSMSTQDRVLAALRARFWLHYWRQHLLMLCNRFPDLYSMSRSFISVASFHIFNRLCDTLVLLALAYSTHYPDQPFCIWLLATNFVEHYFGIARQLLPNFTFAEFVKMTQHIMVRQRILESGLIKTKRERKSAVGYIYNEDLDKTKPVLGDAPLPCSNLTHASLNRLVELAHQEAVHICRDILAMSVSLPQPAKPLPLIPLGSTTRAGKTSDVAEGEFASDDEEEEECDREESEDEEVILGVNQDLTSESPSDEDISRAVVSASSEVAQYSALCQDLEKLVEEAGLVGKDLALPSQTSLHQPAVTTQAAITTSPSVLLDTTSSKVTVRRLLDARDSWQSGTNVKSERTVRISKKFTMLEKVSEAAPTDGNIKSDEAAHRLRIAQEKSTEIKKAEAQKTRELRWKTVAKEIDRVMKMKSHEIVPHLLERNVTAINELQRDSFLIMRTSNRFYIGEVLDIYKKGQSSRYGSISRSSTLQGLSWLSLRVYLELKVSNDTSLETNASSNSEDDSGSDADDDSLPDFSCLGGSKSKYHLHTHAPIANVVYHLGKGALTGSLSKRQLTQLAASRWKSLTQDKATKAILATIPALKIRIPAQQK